MARPPSKEITVFAAKLNGNIVAYKRNGVGAVRELIARVNATEEIPSVEDERWTTGFTLAGSVVQVESITVTP